MKKFLFSVLSVMAICLLYCAEKSTNNVSSAVKQENAYNAVSSYVGGLGYSIDKNSTQEKSFENSQATLSLILNGKGDTCGALLKKNNLWSFALISGGTISEFDVSENVDGNFEIVKRPVVYSDDWAMSKEDIVKSRGLSKVASYGVCQYISYVGVSFGCWSLPDNPIGYYYVVTTKVGDPITAFHYQWCADWQGHGISCPLNETTTNMPYCGFP